MKKNSNWLLIALLLAGLALLVACGGADQTGDEQTPAETPAGTTDETAVQPSAEGDVKTLYVGPELVDCVGVGPQTCMQVKENPADAYTLFYQQIEGFTFEPGYEYELLVSVETIENPPADGSSLKYTLVNIVSQTPVTTESTAELTLVGTLWQLQSIQGMPALVDAEVTAVFGEDGSLSGGGGCNRYNTSYTVDGANLTINDAIASTMMACADPVMQQETAYLAALPTAVTWQIDGSSLTLTDAAGAVVAVYTAVMPTSLTGTTWQLTSFNNGLGGVTSLLADTAITAVFGEDGSLSGSAGCNNYNASYTLDGSNITIDPAISTTRMACAEDVTQQEAAYLAALPNAATFVIQGDSLELRHTTGSLIASYTAAASGSAVTSDSAETSLAGTSWMLTDYNDGQGGVVAVLDDAQITAVFGEDGTLSGNAGCNNYSGTYTVSGSSLTINPAIASTMMACDEAIMQRETAYLAALPAATTFQIEGDVLKLLDANGALMAAFTAVMPATLTGTTWQLTGYNNGQDAVVSLVAGSAVTAVFGDDGSLSGNGGCNNYSTSFTVDGSNIAINSNIASTMMACAEDVMQQETAYLAALPNATTFAVQGDSLELRDANGALIASFTAVQATSLVGPVWTVNTFNNGSQAAVGLLEGSEITMSFGEDGNVQGSAGCNQYFGPYTVNGDAITVGLLGTTRAYCPEPEGKMQQEAQFLAALQSAASFTIQNGTLDIRMTDGAIAVLAAAQ